MSLKIKLRDGTGLPAIGFGTWRGRGKTDSLVPAIEHAVKSGYELIDTAQLYDTEEQVGEAIQKYDRSKIWLETKIWPTHYKENDFLTKVEDSLAKMKTPYVDLLLLHWPVFSPQFDGYPTMKQVWDLCERMVDEGKAKYVGVSNFMTWHIEQLVNDVKPKHLPVVNQIECHPWWPQTELVQRCRKFGIVCQAYRPFGSLAKGITEGESCLIEDPVLVECAKSHDVPVTRLILSWLTEQGIAAVPKSATPARIEANLKLCKLPQETLQKINSISKRHQFCPTPFENGIDPFKPPSK